MRPTDAQPQPTLSVRPRENLGFTMITIPWLNPHTCGWGPNENDPPFTCSPPLTCSTNTENIVGCASDASVVFPNTCVDGAHTTLTIHPLNTPLWKRDTAVCTDDGAPACATLLFPGNPPGTQFRCMPTATVITMRPVPLDVASTQHTSSSVSTATSMQTSPSPTSPESTSPTHHTSKTSPTTTTKADLANGVHTDTGAVAGGVVGGIALLLLLPLFWYLFRKNYPKKKPAGGQQAGGVGGGAGGPYGDQDPEYYYPKYKKPPLIGDSAKNPPLSRDSARHIPIELTGYSPRSYGARGSDSGPADVHQQEREGFGLGSMYADGNGEFQPAGSMTTVTEESAGGSSGQGQSSAMGQAGSGGGLGAEKGKAKAEDGNFNNRAARVSDASSQYSQDGMAWKR